MSKSLIKNQHGRIEAAFSTRYEEFRDVVNMVGEMSGANEEKINSLLCFVEDRFQRVGFIGSVLVDKDKRGEGFGAALLKEYLNTVGKKTEMDFLFARIENPQKKGFSLLEFYKKHGFEPVMISNGELLMVNKNHANEIKNELFPRVKQEFEAFSY
jgi:Acetyltransferase (GNAT) family.